MISISLPIDSLLMSHVEISYLKTVMCKFGSSLKDESRTQSADSSNYSKPRAFICHKKHSETYITFNFRLKCFGLVFTYFEGVLACFSKCLGCQFLLNVRLYPLHLCTVWGMTEGPPLTTMFYPNCPTKSVGLVVPNTLLKVSFFASTPC